MHPLGDGSLDNTEDREDRDRWRSRRRGDGRRRRNGERKDHQPVWQALVAATFAASLSEDYTTGHPKVRPPLK